MVFRFEAAPGKMEDARCRASQGRETRSVAFVHRQCSPVTASLHQSSPVFTIVCHCLPVFTGPMCARQAIAEAIGRKARRCQ